MCFCHYGKNHIYITWKSNSVDILAELWPCTRITKLNEKYAKRNKKIPEKNVWCNISTLAPLTTIKLLFGHPARAIQHSFPAVVWLCECSQFLVTLRTHWCGPADLRTSYNFCLLFKKPYCSRFRLVAEETSNSFLILLNLNQRLSNFEALNDVCLDAFGLWRFVYVNKKHTRE